MICERACAGPRPRGPERARSKMRKNKCMQHATRESGGTHGRGGKGALQRGRVGAAGGQAVVVGVRGAWYGEGYLGVW